MHVVDDVHCFVVNAGNLRQHFLVVVHYLFKVQRIVSQHGDTFHHYSSGVFATSAVDGKQQCFGKVGACAEELDLLTDGLVGYAAGDTVVVAVAYLAHQVVVLVLDRAGIYGYFGTEFLETFRQFGAPQHSHVRLGRRAEVVQCLQEAERGFCHLYATVVEASADSFGNPGGVSGEDVIVGLHTQVAYHAQFDDELVNQLLCKSFVNLTVSQIIFNENVKE